MARSFKRRFRDFRWGLLLRFHRLFLLHVRFTWNEGKTDRKENRSLDEPIIISPQNFYYEKRNAWDGPETIERANRPVTNEHRRLIQLLVKLDFASFSDSEHRSLHGVPKINHYGNYILEFISPFAKKPVKIIELHDFDEYGISELDRIEEISVYLRGLVSEK